MRWKPQRAGLFNIWEYDDQVFDFGDGRLVLRGRNGSGKSNALSLLFPFLFDGVMSAARMDPMGGARSMKSLLLGRDDDDATNSRYRHESGTGYAWMEFVNAMDDDRGDNARNETVTIGIGASATQQRDAHAWFFITEQQVGTDLSLHADDVPLGRKQLTAALAPERADGRFGDVYTTAEEFRSGVDAALFGLGQQRYKTLVDLLLTLRRPHLAGKLDTEHLSSTLSSGLAELDTALIDDVAHSFDDLDKMQEDLDGLSIALEAIERFLPTYREHLVGVGRERAGALVEHHRELTRVQRSIDDTAHQRATVDAQLATRTDELDTNRRARHRLDVEIETIQGSSAFQSATELSEVKRQVESSRRAAVSAHERAAQRSSELADAEAESETARERASVAIDKLAATISEWIVHARSVEVDTEVEREPFDLMRATAAVAERTQQVDEVIEAQQQSAAAATEAERLADEAERTSADLDESLASRDEAHDEVVTALQSLGMDRQTWAETSDATLQRAGTLLDVSLGRVGELIYADSTVNERAEGHGPRASPSPDDDADHLDDRVRTAEDLEPQRVAAVLRSAELAITTALDRTTITEQSLEDSIAGETAERRRIAEEPNPGPPLNPTRPDAGSAELPGSPVYSCVEFAPAVDAADRAGIESALAAAGLLDARITPPGSSPDFLDAILSGDVASSGRIEGSTLADLFTPVPTDELTADRIMNVLASISLAGDVVAMGTDGRWRLGPLAGRFRQEHAAFIGHEARERRRAERLADLDTRLGELHTQLQRLQQHSADLATLLGEVRRADGSFPPALPVTTLHRRLLEVRAIVVEREGRQRDAAGLADTAARHADTLSIEVQRIANARRLPVDAAGLVSIRAVLTQCSAQHDEIERRQAALTASTEGLEAAKRRENEAKRLTAQAVAEASDAHGQAEGEALRYDLLSADIGADARQAVVDLEAARTTRVQVDATVDALIESIGEARATLAQLSERHSQASEQRVRRLRDVDTATTRFAAVRSSEVADVLSLPGFSTDGDALPAARSLLSSTTEVSSDATNRMERDFRTVLLDGVRSGHEPSMPKLDGFDVVRVGTADGDLAIGTIAADLRNDRDRLDRLLSDREREIFETHLLTRVGESLRKLLLDADAFESTINAEMTKAPTASGLTVELKWAISEEDRSIRQAVETLRFSPENMTPEQRTGLRDFFTHRIAELRAADPGSSFAEILTMALDYRSWHRFDLYVRSIEGGRSRVTRSYYRGLSGGEAATVLHLPLFAAASAHYASGSISGPRIIALDEAFAGIDDQMRGRLMGLLVQLDLDVILTSHEFWGFYGQVPGLVLYDLNRKPPVPGVYAQRFEWNSSDPERGNEAGAGQ